MYRWQQFKIEPLREISVYKGKDHSKVTYIEPAFYDSETSKDTFTEVGVEHVIETWVYLWAVSIGKHVYYGRSILEFIELLKIVIRSYNLCNDRIMLIYVHNLPYDISYMWTMLFDLDPDLKCLALSPNKPFVVQMHNVGIEFRCSYRLANRSLDKWGKDLGIKARKKVGMIDYSERHTPTDVLQTEQYIYMYYDVAALKECFYKECEITGYHFANIPLTSTGYVRRIFKREYNKNFKKFIYGFQRTKPNAQQYERLLRASAGGMSEVGRHVIGRMVQITPGSKKQIRHRDWDSHYPTQQIVNGFPMQPITVYDAENNINKKRRVLESKIQWYLQHNYWLVMDVLIKDLQIKDGVTCPFLMRSKIKAESKATDVLHVNGKVVSIRHGCVRSCFTSDDYIIFRQQYDFKMTVIAMDAYNLEPLPEYMTDTIKYYYLQKNALKAKHKQTGAEEDRVNLMLSKGRLNGIFGCTYTQICRDDIKINNNLTWKVDRANLQEGIDKYYNTRGNCLAYQWGVRTTSAARLELFMAIQKIGYENFLYCDTDSAFYISTPENEKILNAWNDELQQKSKDAGYFVEYDGKKKYFNYFDDENENIISFKALHSKCYGYITDDNTMQITVAGVPRMTEGITREQELGELDNLKDGFLFSRNGGTRAEYLLHPLKEYCGIMTAGGCAILDTTKQLSECVCNEQELVKWEVE